MLSGKFIGKPSMANKPVGRYRCPAVGNREEEAYVEDGTIGSFVPRSRYEDRGYTPPFDKLPTQEEYEKGKGASNA
jgi:hypothetical protein